MVSQGLALAFRKYSTLYVLQEDAARLAKSVACGREASRRPGSGGRSISRTIPIPDVSSFCYVRVRNGAQAPIRSGGQNSRRFRRMAESDIVAIASGRAMLGYRREWVAGMHRHLRWSCWRTGGLKHRGNTPRLFALGELSNGIHKGRKCLEPAEHVYIGKR